MDKQQRIEQIKKYVNEGGSLIIPKVADKRDADYGAIFGYKGEAPRNWRPYQPEFEDQLSSTFCTNYGYTNCLETKAKKDGLKDPDGNDINLSDKYSAKTSGTTQKGNGLETVAYTGLKKGVVLEKHAPLKPEWLRNQAKYWNQIMDISSVPADAKRYMGPTYSKVRPSISYMKQALAYSPLYVGAYIGYNWENNVVYPLAKDARKSGHAFQISFIDNYIHILDSLGRPNKLLSLNYPIFIAKSFRDLPEGWKDINSKKKAMISLKRAKDTKKVFVCVGIKKYWVNSWVVLGDFIEEFGFKTLKEAQDSVQEVSQDHLDEYIYAGNIGNPTIWDFIFGKNTK